MRRVLIWGGMVLFSFFAQADEPSDCFARLSNLTGPAIVQAADEAALKFAREYAQLLAQMKNPNPAVRKQIQLEIERFRHSVIASKDYERLQDLVFVPLLRLSLDAESRDMRTAAIELYSLLGPTSEFALEHLHEALREILAEFGHDLFRLRQQQDSLPPPVLPEPNSSLVSLLHLLPTLDSHSEESMDIIREFLEVLIDFRASETPIQVNENFYRLVADMENALIGGLLALDMDYSIEFLELTLPILHRSQMESLPPKGLPLATYYVTLVAFHSRFYEPQRTERLHELMDDHYRIASNNYRNHLLSPTAHWDTLNTLGAAMVRNGGGMNSLYDASGSLFRQRAWTNVEFWEAAHYIEAVRLANVDLTEKPTAHQLVFNAVKRFTLELPRNPGPSELKALDSLLQSLLRFPQSRKPEALKNLIKLLTKREDLPPYLVFQANQAIRSGVGH